ncbi:MAG: class I SAM-dependent methyltransferase [Nanoarchaeota archaeon]
MMTDKANYEGYAQHARTMSQRVRLRRSHPELTAIDNKVIDVLKEKLRQKESISLLDAGCGTGERLKMILEPGRFDPAKIKAVGVDFCDPLIDEARKKIIQGKSLYQQVKVQDLLNLQIDKKFDVIICLFSVLNNVGREFGKVLQLLSQGLKEEGVIIFDFLHPLAAKHLFKEAHPELIKKYGPLSKGEYYYSRRSDSSWGKVFIFSWEDAEKSMKEINLTVEKVCDINNYKTAKGKFSIIREYLLNEGTFKPNLNSHQKTWENSILVIARREKEA